MKRLEQYLTESQRSYRYTIKFAGDVDAKRLDAFKTGLKKFDVVSISELVNTPIQKDPAGFDHLKNESVGIMKVEFKYPATEPQITRIAQLNGMDVNRIRVIQSDYNDSISNEADLTIKQTENGAVLEQPEFIDVGGKKAADDYGKQYLHMLPEKSKYKSAGLSDVAEVEKPVEKASPSLFSSVKLPVRPKTGSSK